MNDTEETPAKTQVELDMIAGLWVPMHFGNRRFKIARLLRGRWRTQEESKERFDSLEQAQKACKERNG